MHVSETSDDASRLDPCECSEDEATALFDRALAEDLGPELRTMLVDERERIERHRVQLHSLRSRLAGGGLNPS